MCCVAKNKMQQSIGVCGLLPGKFGTAEYVGCRPGPSEMETVVELEVRVQACLWIVPEVFLKHGIEEMSWATPSAHAAIQGAIASVLIYHNPTNIGNWVVNMTVVLFVLFSRLYLAVHWPQDVVSGAVAGIVTGIVVCVSNVHTVLLNFAETHHPVGGLLSITIGTSTFP